MSLKLKPSDIHFSLDSISNIFGKTTQHRNTYIGETLDELLHGTATVFSIPIISVFRYKGKWFTTDNRRLWVFRKAEEFEILRLIPVLKTFDFDAAKFTTGNGGLNVRVRRNDPGGQTWLLLEDERSRNKYENYTHTLTQTNMCEQNIPRHKSCDGNQTYSKALKENISYSDLEKCSEKTYNERSTNRCQNYIKTSNQIDIGKQNFSKHTSYDGSSNYSKSSKENCPYSGLENNTEKSRIFFSRTSNNFNHLSFDELKSRRDHNYKIEYDSHGSSSYSESSKENHRSNSDLISYSEKPRQSYSGPPSNSRHNSLEKLSSRPDHEYKRENDSYGSPIYSKSSIENCHNTGVENNIEKPKIYYSRSSNNYNHLSFEELKSRTDHINKREYDPMACGSSSFSESSIENCHNSGMENNSEKPRKKYSRTSTNFNHLSFEELNSRTDSGYKREYDTYGSSRYSKSPKENRPHCDLSYAEKPRQSYSNSLTYSSYTSFEKLKSRRDHNYKIEYDSHGSSSNSESSKENRSHSDLISYSEKPRQSYPGSPSNSRHNSLEKLSSRPDCGFNSEYDSYGSSNCSKSSKKSCLYSGLVNYSEKLRQSFSKTSTNFNHGDLSFEELEWRSSYGYETEYSRHKDRCTRTKLDLIDGVIAVGALAYLFMKLL